MNALRTGFTLQLVALVAALTLAPTALGATGTVVPPNNSGANQYTEVYPTGGGNKNAYAEGDEISPGKVLGERNVKKLKDRGEEGEEVAELAAETAPLAATEVVQVEEEPSEGGGAGGGSGGAGNDGGSGGGTQSPPSPQQPRADAGTERVTIVAVSAETEGSGAFGQIVSQAFGTSGTGMGLLLPLLMLAAILWAFLFAARQRRRPAG